MEGWTFEDALATIQSPVSIPVSILQGKDGLRLGDIPFAKILTTLRMRTIALEVLEKWLVDGSFNLEGMADGDYSPTTTLLILLNTNPEGTTLESTSIRLIVQRCLGPVETISSITRLIHCACSLIEIGWQTSTTVHRTFCTLISDYGSYMAFATDPPFYTAYPLSCARQDNPTKMNFRSPENHPVSFNADVLLVHQLLTRD